MAQILLRVTDVSELFTTAYGLIMVVKVQLLVVLVAIGWFQRSRSLPAIEVGHPELMRRVAGIESILMMIVLGLSVALSRTPIESRGNELIAHEYGLPPVPGGVLDVFTLWRINALALIIATVLGGAYLQAVLSLNRRGIQWAHSRSFWFGAGLLVLVFVGCSGLGTYTIVLFPVVLVHAVLFMLVIPTLLIFGRPLELVRMVSTSKDGIPQGWEKTGKLWVGLREHNFTYPAISIVVLLAFTFSYFGTAMLSQTLWSFWGRFTVDLLFLCIGVWACSTVIATANSYRRGRLIPALSLASGLGMLCVWIIVTPHTLHAEYFAFFLPAYADNLRLAQLTGAAVSLVIICSWVVLITFNTEKNSQPARDGQEIFSHS